MKPRRRGPTTQNRHGAPGGDQEREWPPIRSPQPRHNLQDLICRTCRSCGCVNGKKDGAERLNFTAFYEALLEAKGGRKLSYTATATVLGNGNLLIGKAYTTMLNLEPGDEFEIKLGHKQIHLVAAGGADGEE